MPVIRILLVRTLPYLMGSTENNPYEAIASAVAFLKYMNKSTNVSYVITTHFLILCKLSNEPQVRNCHMATKAIGNDFKYI